MSQTILCYFSTCIGTIFFLFVGSIGIIFDQGVIDLFYNRNGKSCLLLGL